MLFRSPTSCPTSTAPSLLSHFTLPPATTSITYWLPKFVAIRDRGQHIAFRFVEQDAYEQAARLEVQPKPDVVTRIFMTFKGVEVGEKVWTLGGKGIEEVDWREVVGVTMDADDGSKFRVLEWGGMEVLS